ncbi:MAG TPA: M48 family metallopeptidase [Acidobacteriota bacterium]|nr:M48 family metallopeptidase [Acidobacteriota bacterium]
MSLFSRSLLRGALVALAVAGAALTLRAAVPAFDPVAETEKIVAQLPADARAKSDAYFEGGYWITLWDVVVTLGLTALLYRLGIYTRLRTAAERVTRSRVVHGLVFLTLLVLVSWVVDLPWDYYTGFVREHHYGLSNLSLGGWLGERATGLIPDVIASLFVGSLLYLAIRRSPGRWWIRAAIATPFFMILLFALGPVFISPLFNEYTPLANAKLRDPILAMARANGVPVDNVYQFDASKQSKRISANVSGALNTIRVSLNDNLLTRCTPAQVQAVMGHELGHYVLNHVYELVIYFSLLIAAGFWFVNSAFWWVQQRWGEKWGVRDISDYAGLPVILACFSVFMLFAEPVKNSIIRSNEVEADLYGLNTAREPDAFAQTALQLSEYRKIHPGKWEEILFFDHPSGYNRILMSMRWKAEHLNEPAAPPKGSE